MDLYNLCFSSLPGVSQILRNIDLDTVLIVHQKSTLSTARPYKNDARTVGEEKFREFVFTDYFEAFEFKNRKNEVFNKNFLNAQELTEDIRFITGNDTGDRAWEVRKTKVARLIQDYGFDVIGFQESTSDQRTYLKSQLSAYSFQESGYEEPCIAWKSSRFTKLDWGQFWLSPNPDTPNSKPGSPWIDARAAASASGSSCATHRQAIPFCL